MNIAIGRAGLIGGEAERDGKFNGPGTKRNFAPGNRSFDDFLIVKPGRDLGRRNGDLDMIPVAGIKADALGGFVLRGVKIIEAGESDCRPAPASQNQAAKRVAHRKRQAAKKIAAVSFHGVERYFVIGFRERAIGPIDAGHDTARGEMDFVGRNRDFAGGDKIGVGPVVEIAAIEQRRPVGGPSRRRRRLRAGAKRHEGERQGDGESESEHFHGSNCSGMQCKFNIR